MGRGNVCVFGPYEGLFFVDNDDLTLYRKEDKDNPGEFDYRLRRDIDYSEFSEWEYCETYSWIEQEQFERRLVQSFTKRFPSFKPCGEREWINRDQRAIMESNLFYVCLEDNEWSIAVELIQKENSCYEPYSNDGLQKKHYRNYLNVLRDCLFEQFEELGIYSGAWTSGRIRREDLHIEDEKSA